jgi:hypothetical protein
LGMSSLIYEHWPFRFRDTDEIGKLSKMLKRDLSEAERYVRLKLRMRN